MKLHLKPIALAAVAIALTPSANAGSLSAPDIEPMVEQIDEMPSAGAARGSDGILLPLIALAILVAVVASDSSDTDGSGGTDLPL